MSLREACKHGVWYEHLTRDLPTAVSNEGWCPGGRILTDAEALRTLLFDVCANSAEHPGCRYLAACINGMLHCNKCGLIEQCFPCGGSGRVPKDGVLGEVLEMFGRHEVFQWLKSVSVRMPDGRHKLDPEGDS
jgi:hypothetical protein